MTRRSVALYLSLIGFLLILSLGWYAYALRSQPESDLVSPTIQPPEIFTPSPDPVTPTVRPSETFAPTPKPELVPFDGLRAYAAVQTQVAFGPRIPGTDGHAQAVEWMQGELVKAGWQVEIQESEVLGHPIQNIVAKRSDESPQIIVGAHYDTRMFSDNDPDFTNHTQPVPGANDGASGVAVLLELARTLPEDITDVWLVFFDAEDNGRIEGWDWTLGSPEFVRNNSIQPHAVVVVDMIGDADLNIYKEHNSDPDLTTEIWKTAESLGYGNKFISEYKYSMQDDHRPFVQAGMRAALLIDFDYPYWHTVADTPDKVSAQSLEAVGRTLWTWITQQSGQN